MDPDSNSIILQLVILLILIGVNAFFAMSEIAIVTFNDNKLKKLAEDGNKRANAKSIVGLLSMRFLPDDEYTVLAEGQDAKQAATGLASFIARL